MGLARRRPAWRDSERSPAVLAGSATSAEGSVRRYRARRAISRFAPPVLRGHASSPSCSDWQQAWPRAFAIDADAKNRYRQTALNNIALACRAGAVARGGATPISARRLLKRCFDAAGNSPIDSVLETHGPWRAGRLRASCVRCTASPVGRFPPHPRSGRSDLCGREPKTLPPAGQAADRWRREVRRTH